MNTFRVANKHTLTATIPTNIACQTMHSIRHTDKWPINFFFCSVTATQEEKMRCIKSCFIHSPQNNFFLSDKVLVRLISQLTFLRLRFLLTKNNNTLSEPTNMQIKHVAQCQDTVNAQILAMDTIVQVRQKENLKYKVLRDRTCH